MKCVRWRRGLESGEHKNNYADRRVARCQPRYCRDPCQNRIARCCARMYYWTRTARTIGGGAVMEERWTREQIEAKTRGWDGMGRERAYDESSPVRRFLFAPPASPARFNLVCLLLRRRNEPRKRFPLLRRGALAWRALASRPIVKYYSEL